MAAGNGTCVPVIADHYAIASGRLKAEHGEGLELADRVNSPAGHRPAVRAEANEGEGQLTGIAAEDRTRPQPVLPRSLEDLVAEHLRMTGFRRRV
jgi:hypothetical protein